MLEYPDARVQRPMRVKFTRYDKLEWQKGELEWRDCHELESYKYQG